MSTRSRAKSHARTGLETCLHSHQHRASVLREAVAKLGGVPARGAPAWEALVNVVEGLADDIGDAAAVAALDGCEAQELADCRRDLPGLEAAVRQIVETQILPRQQQTQAAIADLNRQLH